MHVSSYKNGKLKRSSRLERHGLLDSNIGTATGQSLLSSSATNTEFIAESSTNYSHPQAFIRLGFSEFDHYSKLFQISTENITQPMVHYESNY